MQLSQGVKRRHVVHDSPAKREVLVCALAAAQSVHPPGARQGLGEPGQQLKVGVGRVAQRGLTGQPADPTSPGSAALQSLELGKLGHLRLQSPSLNGHELFKVLTLQSVLRTL